MKDYTKMRLLLKKTQRYTELPESQECYDDITITTHIEGQNTRKERKKFYRHVTRCDVCLDRLMAVDSLLSDLKSEGLLTKKDTLWASLGKLISLNTALIEQKLRSVWQILMKPGPVYRWAAVILVLSFISLLVLKPDYSEEMPIQTRESDSDVIGTEIQLLYPANRAIIKIDKPEFQWSQTSINSSFHFLLLNSNGDIVFESNTSDTNMKLPIDIHLQPAMTYFWQVEAHFEQGFSITSDMISFTYVSE